MRHLLRTDSANTDFQQLVALLDADLRVRDGEDHAFYAQYNKSDAIKHVVVAYADEQPVGCGAIKYYEDGTMEVKRMYTSEGSRGKGIASVILTELETWAAQLGYSKCILETGLQQPEAIALYKKCNYSIIPNYGQYAGVENSVCFEKQL
jgi:GNAT superfamily N-acetyltransferase